MTLFMNTAAPSKAAWQGSRGHQCAPPGKQQQPRALISRPACSTAFTRALAFSGDMVCQCDTDALGITDGVCGTWVMSRSDADKRQCPCLHLHDGRVKAAFTCRAQILLAYRTTKPRTQDGRRYGGVRRAAKLCPRSNSCVREQDPRPCIATARL